MTMRPSIILSEEAEARLRNIMEAHELASLEDAAEFVFKQVERKALLIKKIYANPSSGESWKDAFYPEYDLEKIRALDLPQSLRKDAA